MVLTLLRGLNGQFWHMVSILKMHRHFPTFEEAHTQLLLKEINKMARVDDHPAATVLVSITAATARPTEAAGSSSCYSNNQRQGNSSNNHCRVRGGQSQYPPASNSGPPGNGGPHTQQ
jgi:hypothetical protein